MELFGIIGIGIIAFISTNIDDIFVLIAFFADRKCAPLQVILGQYLGIGLLITISVVSSFVTLIIPAQWIGLLGVLPIIFGIKRLLDQHRTGKQSQHEEYPSIATGSL
jgi:cadmium resistance protein CadD (predicted permease)